MLTAYDAPSARLLDAAGVDVLLVGDSVEMTVYGEASTLSATMDSMVRHARAVSRAAAARARRRRHAVSLVPGGRRPRPCATPGRFLSEGGCGAVKVEGGRRILPAVSGDPRRRHPGHGARRPDAAVVPQARRLQGPGARRRARRTRSWRTRRRSPRRAASRSSSSACPRRSRPRSRARSRIPTIGIGAGAACDGQVLVFHDVMGLNPDFKPKFARRYADLATVIGRPRATSRGTSRTASFPSARRVVLAARSRRRCGGCIEHGRPQSRARCARARRGRDARGLREIDRLRSHDGRAPRGASLARAPRAAGVRLRRSSRSSSTRSSSGRARTSPAIRAGPRRTRRCSADEGVDLLYRPDAAAFYPPGFSTAVDVARRLGGRRGRRRGPGTSAAWRRSSRSSSSRSRRTSPTSAARTCSRSP